MYQGDILYTLLYLFGAFNPLNDYLSVIQTIVMEYSLASTFLFLPLLITFHAPYCTNY